MYRGEHELPAEDEVSTDVVTVAMTGAKGRRNVSLMSERELLEEAVTAIRFASDKIDQFLTELPNNPMFKMLGKFGF